MRKLTGERGQTLLEFALVAPLVLVFLLALVDFGIAIDRRLVLDHAVREGARYASVGGDYLTDGVPSDMADVQLHAYNQAQGIPDSSAAFDVCYDGDGGVNVSIDYDYNFVTGFTSFFGLSVGPSIPIYASASARIERALLGAVPSCS